MYDIEVTGEFCKKKTVNKNAIKHKLEFCFQNHRTSESCEKYLVSTPLNIQPVGAFGCFPDAPLSGCLIS
jgi:hypothetical protein